MQLFTGKGGVGKSTVAAATAVAAAARGHRPLVVELGHRASMEGIFGREGIGYRPVDVGRGVQAMNMDVDEALLDYVASHLRFRGLARRALGASPLQRFFHAAPAVAEVVSLHKLRALERARRWGRPEWHPILVDLDATGHALMFLELPRVFEGLAREGPLRALLDGLSELLRDEATTALHLVTVPGELPVQETAELYESLTRDPRVSLGRLIINMIPEPLFGEEDLQILSDLAARDDLPAALEADIALAKVSVAALERAEARIGELVRHVPLPRVELPMMAEMAMSAAGLEELGERLILAQCDESAS